MGCQERRFVLYHQLSRSSRADEFYKASNSKSFEYSVLSWLFVSIFNTSEDDFSKGMDRRKELGGSGFALAK